MPENRLDSQNKEIILYKAYKTGHICAKPGLLFEGKPILLA